MGGGLLTRTERIKGLAPTAPKCFSFCKNPVFWWRTFSCCLSHFFVIIVCVCGGGGGLVCWPVFSKGNLVLVVRLDREGWEIKDKRIQIWNVKRFMQHRPNGNLYYKKQTKKNILLHSILCGFLLKWTLVAVIHQQLLFLLKLFTAKYYGVARAG